MANPVTTNTTLSVNPANLYEGDVITFVLDDLDKADKKEYKIKVIDLDPKIESKSAVRITESKKLVSMSTSIRWEMSTSGLAAGSYEVQVDPDLKKNNESVVNRFTVLGVPIVSTQTYLQRTATSETNDQGLWAAIRNRTNAIGFDRYRAFIDLLFCDNATQGENINENIKKFHDYRDRLKQIPELTIHGPYAYSVLKVATQVFLTLEAGIRENQWVDKRLSDAGNLQSERYRLNDQSVTFDTLQRLLGQYLGSNTNHALPYLDRIVGALISATPGDPKKFAPYCHEILQDRFTKPSLIELIWSYWLEEGMLAQTMNAITRRFQNQRSGSFDPLAEMEIDPLRPLNNLLWGYVQDEHNRLTVRRRAYEYDHHYGIKLVGRAVPELQAADSRSKFIEAFHNLLYRTALFYREDADTTVISDAFPLLNALKDVHLLLAEGAHNQYGDLPWTARAEMLTEQWMLARPEMREFLRGRHMVPYQEAWMGAVDAMKKLQGWGDTTISHFHELAVDGERILLSIRFGDWSELDNTQEQARNWARYWKPEIQRYLYGYLAVTGVDLMVDVTDNREAAIRYLQPSALLESRLAAQPRRGALPSPPKVAILPAGVTRTATLSRVSHRQVLPQNKIDG